MGAHPDGCLYWGLVKFRSTQVAGLNRLGSHNTAGQLFASRVLDGGLGSNPSLRREHGGVNRRVCAAWQWWADWPPLLAFSEIPEEDDDNDDDDDD